MKKVLLVLAVALTAVAHAESGKVSLDNCVIQAAIPGSGMTGAFMDITYSGDAEKALISATADELTKHVEIHEMVMAEGVMKMQQIERFELKNGVNKLEKGGYHIMLMDLQKLPQAGETYPLSLTFDGGQTETCEAMVKSPEDIQSKHKPMDSGQVNKKMKHN